MKESYLVQRLEPPFKATGKGILGLKDNPFAFGGGYLNGGLSSEAMDLLRDIFRFDYMGAAEYEFGAVPKALQEIAKQADDGVLLSWSFDILLSQVMPDWRDKSKPERGAKATVYALARADWTEEVEARVRLMAKEGFKYRAKESVMIDRALRPNPELGSYRTEVCGWLELDNGYMFFTDREMWSKTAALFGVQVEVPA